MVPDLLDHSKAWHLLFLGLLYSIPCPCPSARWCRIPIDHCCLTRDLSSSHISCVCRKSLISCFVDRLVNLFRRSVMSQGNWWLYSLSDWPLVLLTSYSRFVVSMTLLRRKSIDMSMKCSPFSVKCTHNIQHSIFIFSFGTLAGVTLFLLILTSLNAAICWHNFDKGLKGHCKCFRLLKK